MNVKFPLSIILIAFLHFNALPTKILSGNQNVQSSPRKLPQKSKQSGPPIVTDEMMAQPYRTYYADASTDILRRNMRDKMMERVNTSIETISAKFNDLANTFKEQSKGIDAVINNQSIKMSRNFESQIKHING